MKNYALLLILPLLILPLCAVFIPIQTHPVDLPFMVPSQSVTEIKSEQHTSLKKLLNGVTPLSNTDVYSILCGLSAVLLNKTKFFAFPSGSSENIYKEIANSYQELKKESQEKANGFLGWALIEMTKKLQCFSPTQIER